MAKLDISCLIVTLCALVRLTLVVAENVIVPGAAWTDTSGNLIQAHGGGFLKVSELKNSFDRGKLIDHLVGTGWEHVLLVWRG